MIIRFYNWLLIGCVTFLLSVQVAAQETANHTDTDSQEVQENRINRTTRLKRAQHANTIGRVNRATTAEHATRAGSANRAATADNADLIDRANTTQSATTAQNALQLGGVAADFYSRTERFSSGTLSVERLNTIMSGDRIDNAIMNGGTYSIDITGNASSSNTTTYSNTAGSAIDCTGGREACDYYSWLWSTTTWSGWGTCIEPGTQSRSRSATCNRSDTGPLVYDDSQCTGAGLAKPSTVDNQACSLETYAYDCSSWSGWSTCNGTNQNRTRSCSCKRDSDGVTVANSYCDGSPPSESTTRSCYTYSGSCGSWSSYGSCSGGSQTRTRSCTCTRSDGATVSDSYCGGFSETSSRTCTYSSSCGSWGSYGSCSGGYETRTRSCSCRRSDGASVSLSYCGNPSTSSSRTCYSYSTSCGSWSSYSACSNGSQSRSRSCSCRRNDGANVSLSYCGNPSTSSSRSCSVPVTYNLSCSGWGSYSPSVCPSTERQTRTRSCTCRRSTDNASVSVSYCGSPSTSQTRTCSYNPPANYTWSALSTVTVTGLPTSWSSSKYKGQCTGDITGNSCSSSGDWCVFAGWPSGLYAIRTCR